MKKLIKNQISRSQASRAPRSLTSSCRKSGFTLIETLTALLIFSTSIVVLIAATSGGFSNTNYAKNKFIASYLAQEGVEVARNTRDSSDWSAFNQSNLPSDLNCLKCVINGDLSIFDRAVDVSVSLDEAKITSTVTWDQGLVPRQVEYIEYLFDWQ